MCYQSGDSDSEQETEQFQMSDQENQVISGDTSINSGNNIHVIARLIQRLNLVFLTIYVLFMV